MWAEQSRGPERPGQVWVTSVRKARRGRRDGEDDCDACGRDGQRHGEGGVREGHIEQAGADDEHDQDENEDQHWQESCRSPASGRRLRSGRGLRRARGRLRHGWVVLRIEAWVVARGSRPGPGSSGVWKPTVPRGTGRRRPEKGPPGTTQPTGATARHRHRGQSRRRRRKPAPTITTLEVPAPTPGERAGRQQAERPEKQKFRSAESLQPVHPHPTYGQVRAWVARCLRMW